MTKGKDFFDEAAEEMEESITDDEGEIGADEWDPKNAGEALRGVFLKAVPKPTRYGLGYNVIVKDLDTNVMVKVWCKRSMLRGQLLDAEPKPGKLIMFKYNGTKEAANGNEYHSYQVRAEESDPDYWAGVTHEGAKAQMEFDERGPRTVANATPDDGNDDPF